MRPRCLAIVGSTSVFLKAFSCASVPSSSAPIKRLYPATSAARIAVSRRSTGSLLKTHPRLGKLDVHHSSIVGRCPARTNVRFGGIGGLGEGRYCAGLHLHSREAPRRRAIAVLQPGVWIALSVVHT